MIIVHFCTKRGVFYSHNGVITAKKHNEFAVKKEHNRIETRNFKRLLQAQSSDWAFFLIQSVLPLK